MRLLLEYTCSVGYACNLGGSVDNRVIVGFLGFPE